MEDNGHSVLWSFVEARKEENGWQKLSAWKMMFDTETKTMEICGGKKLSSMEWYMK